MGRTFFVAWPSPSLTAETEDRLARAPDPLTPDSQFKAPNVAPQFLLGDPWGASSGRGWAPNEGAMISMSPICKQRS